MGKAMQVIRTPFEAMYMACTAMITTILSLALIPPLAISMLGLDATGLIEVQWLSAARLLAFSAAYCLIWHRFSRVEGGMAATAVVAGIPMAFITTAMAYVGAGIGLAMWTAYALYQMASKLF